MEALPGRIESVTVGKPTLEDVFIRRTGHRFWEGPDSEEGGGMAAEVSRGQSGQRSGHRRDSHG
jgi:hypothetical protein